MVTSFNFKAETTTAPKMSTEYIRTKLTFNTTLNKHDHNLFKIFKDCTKWNGCMPTRFPAIDSFSFAFYKEILLGDECVCRNIVENIKQ